MRPNEGRDEQRFIRSSARPDTTTQVHPYGEGGQIVETFIRDRRVAGHLVRYVELGYIDARGGLARLNQLLPAGVSMAYMEGQESFSYNHKLGAVVYTDVHANHLEDKIDGTWSPGGLLAILHEIGHARQENTLQDEDYELLHRLRQVHGDEATFEPAELPRAMNVLARERQAWAYALTTLQDFRRERRIDLEPDLPTYQEILATINCSLIYYESVIMAAFGSREFAPEWLRARLQHIEAAQAGNALPLARYAMRPNHGLPTHVPPLAES